MALSPAPLLNFEANFRWRNKHKNVERTVFRLYNAWNRSSDGQEPPRQRWRAGLNALRQIVIDAQSMGRRVRAYGGAWSLSDAAECPDLLINTKPLNYVSIGLKREQVRASAAPVADRLVFAQCGIHVMELHTAVEGAGLALPTSGASNGQTLAGAVATGTHGAGVQVGSMQDYVRGLHLVIEDGRHLYIERASAPIVSKAFVDTLGAELRRDDGLFDAALVSFGSFGILHGLLIETVPLYDLVKHRFRVDHDTAFDWLALDFRVLAARGLPPAAPYHFEIVFNPYRHAPGEAGAFVTAMYQLPGTASPSAAEAGGIEPGADALTFLGEITDFAPQTIPTVVSKLVEGQLTPASGSRATPGRTFGSTNIRGNVLSSELGVALADARRAIVAINDVARAYPFPGLIAVRFVKSSAATLAFTGFAPITCTIELPAAGTDRTEEFFRRVFQRLDQDGIRFSLHWGQCGDFSAQRVRAAYGGAVDRWLDQRRKLLSPAGRELFSNAFVERCGLAG
jgi:FAD/FMN-containing dehydrogenase